MKHIILILFTLIASYTYADEYKLLYISTESIEIGGKKLQKGDTFSDKDEIKWTLPSQSIRIKRIKGDGTKIKIVTKYE